MGALLSERIKELMAYHQWKAPKVAGIAGFKTPTAIYQWQSGDTKSIGDIRVANKIAEASREDAIRRKLGAGNNASGQAVYRSYMAVWLAKGEGPKFAEHLKSETTNVEPAPTLVASRRIPVSGAVKGGPDGFLEGSQYPPDHGEGYIETWARDKLAYALRVIGDSMAPRYRAGEFIVVTPSIEAMPGMDVVVCLKDGRKLLKNLGWKRVNTVQLLSVNDNYPPITVGLDEIESISRVASSAPPDAFIDG